MVPLRLDVALKRYAESAAGYGPNRQHTLADVIQGGHELRAVVVDVNAVCIELDAAGMVVGARSDNKRRFEVVADQVIAEALDWRVQISGFDRVLRRKQTGNVRERPKRETEELGQRLD